MITFKNGNLFEEPCEALVNPVNCVGVMGKGQALEFKKRFPDNFSEYARACWMGKVQPGRLLVFQTYQPQVHRFIINFPTKRHWNDNSRLEDIEAGIQALAGEIRQRRIRSIAIPALGSGLGGLQWSRVRPIIEEGLQELEKVSITIYEPLASPETPPAGHPRRRRAKKAG